MLESIGDIFLSQQKGIQTGSDAKPLIETWLREHIKSDKVYCEDVSSGGATVRVGSPLLYQEVILLWDECREVFQKEYEYSLGAVSVTASYY